MKFIKMTTILLILTIGLSSCGLSAEGKKYNEAQQAFDNGKYKKAIELFSELGDYKDSQDLVDEARVAYIKKAVADEYYSDLYSIAMPLQNKAEYKELVRDAMYYNAIDYYNNGDIEQASALFEPNTGYKDTDAYLKKIEILKPYSKKWNPEDIPYQGFCVEISGAKALMATIHFNVEIVGENVVLDNGSSLSYTLSLKDNKLLMKDGKDGSVKTYVDAATLPTEEEYKAELNRKYPVSTKSNPTIGMTSDEVLASSWGAPNEKNITETAYGQSEQWVYDEGYVYMEDGIVTAIQKTE